jgi:mono/diheme cytochrome c family protein
MRRIILPFLAIVVIVACNNTQKEKEATMKVGQTATSQKEQDPLQESIGRGQLVYTKFCMQCHLANGKGVPGNFPPLAGSNWLREKRAESIRAVKYGQRGEIEVNGVVYDGIMTPMGLSNKEVADVMNYVMNNWGNTQEELVTETEVANIKE